MLRPLPVQVVVGGQIVGSERVLFVLPTAFRHQTIDRAFTEQPHSNVDHEWDISRAVANLIGMWFLQKSDQLLWIMSLAEHDAVVLRHFW